MSSRSYGKPYARDSPTDGLPDGQWLHDKHGGFDRARAAPRATDHAVNAAPNAKLLVDNLHYEVSEKDLASLFGKYGPFARDPRIRFDRSGRSTGAAVVVFEEMDDAVAAKKALDKQLAKGQEISVRFDSAPAGPRGSSSRGGGAASLLARLDGPKTGLHDRAKDRGRGSDTPTGPRADSGVGPHRTRGGRGGRDSGGRDRGGNDSGRERRPSKKAMTAEDLDKELEQYGSKGDDSSAAPQAEAVSGPASSSVPAAVLDEDVVMA